MLSVVLNFSPSTFSVSRRGWSTKAHETTLRGFVFSSDLADCCFAPAAGFKLGYRYSFPEVYGLLRGMSVVPMLFAALILGTDRRIVRQLRQAKAFRLDLPFLCTRLPSSVVGVSGGWLALAPFAWYSPRSTTWKRTVMKLIESGGDEEVCWSSVS